MTDYHDHTNINTPRKDRYKLNVGDIWINAAVCKHCADYIRSRNQHDFVECKCGRVAVDGGSWYSKRSGLPGDMVDISVMFNDVISVYNWLSNINI